MGGVVYGAAFDYNAGVSVSQTLMICAGFSEANMCRAISTASSDP